jgi:hypothetical protein
VQARGAIGRGLQQRHGDFGQSGRKRARHALLDPPRPSARPSATLRETRIDLGWRTRRSGSAACRSDRRASAISRWTPRAGPTSSCTASTTSPTRRGPGRTSSSSQPRGSCCRAASSSTPTWSTHRAAPMAARRRSPSTARATHGWRGRSRSRGAASGAFWREETIATEAPPLAVTGPVARRAVEEERCRSGGVIYRRRVPRRPGSAAAMLRARSTRSRHTRRARRGRSQLVTPAGSGSAPLARRALTRKKSFPISCEDQSATTMRLTPPARPRRSS